MRVSFDAGRLNERGTGVALYDYAAQSRVHLGVTPIIFHEADQTEASQAVARFAAAFPVRAYRDAAERANLFEAERIEVAYALKTTRALYPRNPLGCAAVHEVFNYFEPHGESYAYISPWLAQAASAGRCPAVPHIVDPPSPRGTLRAEFGVPPGAMVVGRHGAADQFNIPFLARALEGALAKRPDLWVMLLNTDLPLRHERVVHVPRTLDRQRVADFVASCDLGLNGRRVGESFGLAIAEYLAQDKPVLVWEGGRDRHHLALIDDPAFRYRTCDDLTQALVRFEPREGRGRWRRQVEAFAPEPVMRAFGRVFLDGAKPKPRLPLGFRLRTKLAERARRWRDDRWMAAG